MSGGVVDSDNAASLVVAPRSHALSDGRNPQDFFTQRWRPTSPLHRSPPSSVSPSLTRRSPGCPPLAHDGWKQEGDDGDFSDDLPPPPIPFQVFQSFRYRLPSLSPYFLSLFLSQPVIRHFSPTLVQTAPSHTSLTSTSPHHFVHLTTTAIEAVGRGDLATFTSFISDHNVLVVFSSLSPLTGLSRFSRPFLGLAGHIEAFTLILSLFTYHDFNATVVPVAHSMEGQVKVMITGDCTARLNRNGRTCTWSWVRFFVWDETTQLIVRMEYYEIDQQVAEAYEEGHVGLDTLPSSQGAETLPFPTHGDVFDPTLSLIADSHCTGDQGLIPADLQLPILLDTTTTLLWEGSWSDSAVSQYPGLPSAPEDGGHRQSVNSSHSSSPSSSNSASSLSPSPSSFSPPTLPLSQPSPTSVPSSLVQPPAGPYIGWGQPGVVDQSSSSLCTCKLYTLIPDCVRDIAVSHSKWGYRGARSICAPCQAVCTFPSDPSGPTIFKPFAVNPSRVVFVCMRLQGEAAVQRQERDEVSLGQPRIKRRLKESTSASSSVGEGDVDDPPVRGHGAGRMMKGRKKMERDIQREFKIDKQGRLMNRNRSLVIHQVSSVEELYLYIFHSAEEAAAARIQWDGMATKLRYVCLTCHRLQEELSLKYQHTGEEIKVAAEQLHRLLTGDPTLVAVD